MVATASESGLYGIKPQLLIPGAKAAAAVKFYGDAFGGEELRRVWHPKREFSQNLLRAKDRFLCSARQR